MKVSISLEELNDIIYKRWGKFSGVLRKNEPGNVWDELRSLRLLLTEALPEPKKK